ncbi:MAG: hypothetical protein HFH08_03605, partial [Bacilli bacterium]|nr:hypothetical protein [Bacilli bacterium]
MMEKLNGLSLDLIIHPGETIKELLEEKEMTQELFRQIKQSGALFFFQIIQIQPFQGGDCQLL